jgi:hypothetical protein
MWHWCDEEKELSGAMADNNTSPSIAAMSALAIEMQADRIVRGRESKRTPLGAGYSNAMEPEFCHTSDAGCKAEKLTTEAQGPQSEEGILSYEF